MRIIIEVEPGASQAVIETDVTAFTSPVPPDLDGGPPAADLLEALGEAAGDVSSLQGAKEAHPLGDYPQNAGSVQGWLVESVESDQRIESARMEGG